MPAVVPILGQVALNAAVGIGLSMLADAIRPQRATQSAQTSRGLRFEITVGEQVAVSSVWGRGRCRPQLTFAQEYGANNSWVKFKFDCGRGWYDALEGASADDKKLTLTGSNADIHGLVVEEWRDASGTPRGWIKWYDGRPGQAADAGLIAAAPTRWGVNHKSTATPYAIVTLNYEPDMFAGNALPDMGFSWRGLRQYDWRKDSTMPGGSGPQRWNDQSTWTWSENAAVLAYNWRRGHWRNGVLVIGMGFSRYANDLAYFTAAANLADEELYFEDTGATLPRYTFGREIFDDEEPLSVLREFEQAWCGSSFDRGGAYAPVPAAAVMPVLTLEDHHRVDGEPVLANRWGKVSAKKTKIHGSYAPVSDLFIPAPYGARIDLALEALTRGPKAMPFDQLYEHRIERAQMRAEIALRRVRFGATRTETFGPIGNVLEPGDAVIRNCEWGPTLMIVESVAPLDDGPGREISFTAWDNSIVPDPDEGFLELPDAIGPLPTAATRILQVPNPDIVPMQRVTGGNEEPFARATWSPIDDPNCDQVIIKVWPTAIPTEVEEFAADARLASARILGPLRPNTAYTGIFQLTRHDLRRTYDTAPVAFVTGAFRPGEIGPDDLTPELREVFDDVQAFMDEEVPAILDELEDIGNDLDALAGAPQFAYGTTYAPGDLVRYLDGIYRATAANTNVLPTDPAYWEQVGEYNSVAGTVIGFTARFEQVETSVENTENRLVQTTRDTRRIQNALLAAAMLNSEQGANQVMENTDQLAASASVSETFRTEVSRIDGTTTALAEQIDVVQAQIENDVAQAISAVTTQVQDVDGRVTAESQRVDQLRAVVGDSGAEVLIKGEAVAAPAGVTARYAVQLQTTNDTGVVGTATMFADVMPDGTTRWGWSADEMAYFAEDGTPLALIDAVNKTLRSANGAFKVHLLTGDLESTGNFSFG